MVFFDLTIGENDIDFGAFKWNLYLGFRGQIWSAPNYTNLKKKKQNTKNQPT